MRFLSVITLLCCGYFLTLNADNNRFSYTTVPSGCSATNLPSGSYSETCSSCCAVDGMMLYCQCQNDSGQSVNAGYDISCCSNLTNDNGNLSCTDDAADGNTGVCG